MQVLHTTYIKKKSNETGKTYRELETLWKKFEREVENDRMMNPSKFSQFSSKNGSLSQEISRRFEEYLVNPIGTQVDEIEDNVIEGEEELLSNEIETELNDDLDKLVDEPNVDGIESTEENSEINLDDFDGLEDYDDSDEITKNRSENDSELSDIEDEENEKDES